MMRHSGGASLQLALRPSRRLGAALLGLAAAAAFSIRLSALPDACLLALPLLAWVAWRGAVRLAGNTLALRADGSAALVGPDGEAHTVEPRALHERGPLGVLMLALGGRVRCWAFAGDVLPAAARRELRLWMHDHATFRDAASARIPSPGQTTSPG